MKHDSDASGQTAEITSVSVGELREHHEGSLRSLAALMVRTLGVPAVAIWDDANNALVSYPEGVHARIAVKSLRASWVGLVASDGVPPTLSASDGRERLAFKPYGEEHACLCVELRTGSKRRRGAMAIVRENGQDLADVTPLLGDFAAAIEAQCELYTAAVSTRLAMLEAAARASVTTSDFPKTVDLRGSLARFLPQGGILVYDHDLRYLCAEGDVLNRFESIRRSPLVGHTLYDVVDAGPYREHLVRLYHDALAGSSNRAEIAYRGRTYECQTMPVSNASGAIVAGVVLVHDVTDSRALDAKLRVVSDRVKAVTAHDVSPP